MKTRKRGMRYRCLGAIAGQLLTAAPAFGAPTATEKAAAEALFQDGTALMQQQSYAAACAKFEASNAIEPGLGVKLWLADCYDRAGRTASAWALFSESAALAQKSGQDERARAAAQRAADLEVRLSKLELAPPTGGLPAGAAVTLDGGAIPAGSVGSALPVDPGEHTVVVSAPGYKSLTLRKLVPEGPASIRVTMAALEPAPPAASTGPGKQDAERGKAEEPSPPGHTQRVLAYSLGGLGVLSLAGGGLLGLRARDLNQQSLEHCLVNEPNACNEQGASLRGQAQNFGNAATAAAIAGGALVATGVVLLLTAPSSKKEIHVGGWLSPAGSGVYVGGKL
jgi:hypothetical protein